MIPQTDGITTPEDDYEAALHRLFRYIEGLEASLTALTAERDALREALEGVLHAGQWLADSATDNGHAVTEHWGHSSSAAREALDWRAS